MIHPQVASQGFARFRSHALTSATITLVAQMGDTDRAWRSLQPALAALREGSHKALSWDEAHGSMPNQPAPSASEPRRPMFFARFSAGWLHASLGTVAVSLLEKERRYADAVQLLQLLLGGNACLGRRGEWWTRLSINLEHLKQVRAHHCASYCACASGLLASILFVMGH